MNVLRPVLREESFYFKMEVNILQGPDVLEDKEQIRPNKPREQVAPVECYVSIPYIDVPEDAVLTASLRTTREETRRKSTKVGKEYQVSNIPTVINFKQEDEQSPEDVGTLLYDPEMGPIKSEKSPIELQKCLRFAVEKSYSLQEKILFEIYLRQYGKHFSRIQDKIQTKGIDEVIEYYYWRKLAIKRQHPLILKLLSSLEEDLEPIMDAETKKQLERDRICTFHRQDSSSSLESTPSKEEGSASEDELDEPDSNINGEESESESDANKLMKEEEDETICDKPLKHKLDNDIHCYYDVSVVVEDIAPLLENSTNEEVENFLMQRKKAKRDHFEISSAHYPAIQTITAPTNGSHEFDQHELLPLCFPVEDSKEEHDHFINSIMGGDLL